MTNRSPDNARERPPHMIRLDLNGVILELPEELVTRLMAENMPDFLRGSGEMGMQEKLMRVSLKGAMRLFLGFTEGQIAKTGADLPPPRIPLGEDGEEVDALQYGIFYILGLGLSILSRSDLRADLEEQEDGVLRIVRLAATTPDVVEAATSQNTLALPDSDTQRERAAEQATAG